MNVVQMKPQETVTGFRLKGPDQEAGRIMRWHVVAGLCLLNGFRKGAELGVSQGRFTMYLCATMHDMKMLAVDRWAPLPTMEGEGSQTYEGWDHEGNYQRFAETCETYFPDRVEIQRMDSASAAASIPDESLDFVFVDADHTYQGCLRDIDAWYPKVRQGGMVCGHDYNLKWPGVIQAVDERFAKKYIARDSVWVNFKK